MFTIETVVDIEFYSVYSSVIVNGVDNFVNSVLRDMSF